MKNNRIEFVDTSRGIAAFLVVWGHTMIGNTEIRNWIYTFHMPLFFFLAGITFNTQKYESLSKMIKSKEQSILIPYLTFGVLFIVERSILTILNIKEYDTIHMFLGLFIGSICGTSFDVGIWFIPCIFSVQCLSYFIQKRCINRMQCIVLASILYIVGWLYISYIGRRLCWNIDTALIAILFFVLGHEMKEVCMKCSAVLCIPCLAINLICGAINTKNYSELTGMYEGSYGDCILYFVAAFSGIFLIISFSKIINSAFIKKLGVNSQFIYYIHLLFISFMRTIIKKIIQYMGEFNNPISKELIAITFSIIVVVISMYLTPFSKALCRFFYTKVRCMKKENDVIYF